MTKANVFMTSVVLVTAEICLLTLCMGLEGTTTGLGVADTDHWEFGGRKIQSSIDPSELYALTLVNDSPVTGLGSGYNDFRHFYGNERISPRNSRRGTKKASKFIEITVYTASK